MVYLALFGLGHVLLGPMWQGLLLLVLSAACAFALYTNIIRSGWGSEGGQSKTTTKPGVAGLATR
jgi:hypothetical protein